VSVLKTDPIHSYEDFCSAFVTPEQRRDFLIDCARQGLKSIRNAWPDHDVRMFVFGSAAKQPVRVGANSDLDIAISGLQDIAQNGHERRAILREQFKKGLLPQNQLLPFDLLTFDVENPETLFALEIMKNGIEIGY